MFTLKANIMLLKYYGEACVRSGGESKGAT